MLSERLVFRGKWSWSCHVCQIHHVVIHQLLLPLVVIVGYIRRIYLQGKHAKHLQKSYSRACAIVISLITLRRSFPQLALTFVPVLISFDHNAHYYQMLLDCKSPDPFCTTHITEHPSPFAPLLVSLDPLLTSVLSPAPMAMRNFCPP